MKKNQKSELYRKVEKFVDESFSIGRHQHSAVHCKLAADAVLDINPSADETIVIAALAHDIDRAFNDRPMKDDEYSDIDYLKAHQETSADIIKNFLLKQGVEKQFSDKVWHLVSKHEEGGDNEQNLVKDADSVSFFRGGNTASIVEKYPGVHIRGKIDWMFNRITSNKAKELVKDLYEKDIKEFGNV